METDFKKLIFMLMYYFPNPSTELIERLVWIHERNQEIQSLIFEWDDETGFIPISPDIRQAMDELMLRTHIRRTKVVENTTGNKDWRNYIWAIMSRPNKSFYFDKNLLDYDTIKIYRRLQSEPSRLLSLIADTKNTLVTKSEMYEMLLEEFRVKSLIKPKRAKSKIAK